MYGGRGAQLRVCLIMTLYGTAKICLWGTTAAEGGRLVAVNDGVGQAGDGGTRSATYGRNAGNQY